MDFYIFSYYFNRWIIDNVKKVGEHLNMIDGACIEFYLVFDADIIVHTAYCHHTG